jgi:hypothetical protein
VLALSQGGGNSTVMRLRQYLNLRQDDEGAIGYVLLWAMGVPASLLFLIFIMRGCS